MLQLTKTNGLKSLLALIFFLSVSYIYFGRGLFSSPLNIYGDGGDPSQYYWFFKWWSYAFTHPVNIFITQKAWPPLGYNLTQATSLLGAWLLSLAFQLFTSPLTALNLIAITTPGIAAWTMYLFCFSLTKQQISAIAAGMLFGFSGYMVAQMLGHLNLTSGIFIIPLLIHLGWRLLNKTIKPSIFTILFSLLFTLLFLISKEIAYTFALSSSLSLMLARKLLQTQAGSMQLKTVLPILFSSYLLAAILLAPYLYYYFYYSTVSHISGIDRGNDLLGLFIPIRAFFISNASFTQALSMNFKLGAAEQNGYLGIPLIIATLIYIKNNWQQKLTRYLVILITIFIIFSLGDAVFIAGNKLMNEPVGRLLWLHIPSLEATLPSRFALYAEFIIAVMMALWLKHVKLKSVMMKLILVVLAILFLAPSQNRMFFPRYTEIQPPVFFTQEQYKQYLKPNEHVLLFTSASGRAVFYQAYSDFYFTLGRAYLGRTPDIFEALAPTMPTNNFKKNILQQKITTIIITDKSLAKWEKILSTLDAKKIKTGGVTLYQLDQGNKQKQTKAN